MAAKNSKKNSKSSKTDHVLNLIGMASAPQKQEPEEETSEPVSEPDKTTEPPAPAPAVSYPTERLAPPILEVARTNHEALSETIHQALNQSLEEELAENMKEELEETTPSDLNEEKPENIPLSQSASNEVALNDDFSQHLEAEPSVGKVASQEESPALQKDGEPEENTPENLTASSAAQEEPPTATEKPSAAPAASSAAPTDGPTLTSTQTLSDGAIVVNVMQILVEESAPRYLEMFHVCPCSRCVADVKALALTQLPAKYVVLEESKKNSMLSYYRYTYQNLITIELTKACSAVIQSPHHLPDLSVQI